MLDIENINKNRDYYGSHDEFHRFVDCYCRRNEISVEEAFSHIQITETRKYYEEKNA